MGIATGGGIRANGGGIQSIREAEKRRPTTTSEITAKGGDEDAETNETLLSVYCTHESELLNGKLSIFSSLSAEDQAAVPELGERLQALGSRITANGKFLQTLMEHGSMFLRSGGTVASGDSNGSTGGVTAQEVRQLLEDIGRDWSTDGAARRTALYRPMLDAVVRAHNEGTIMEDSLDRSKFRVLVPSACTGRLCWELAKLGFAVEGNEVSSARLAACNYLLNHADSKRPDTIYPYAHRHGALRSATQQLAEVLVPDVTASALSAKDVEFGMRVGAFCDVYPSDADFDCVASCLAFELDEEAGEIARTAHSVLKPGGVWVFLGPTPVPHDDAHVAALLSNGEFLTVVKRAGFKVLEERTLDIPLDDEQCMRSRTFSALMFVALKVRDGK